MPSPETKKFDIAALVDLLKNVGVVFGGLGSFAALFLWIGNAIIVARLRAYNLYGIVHYTDEYVKEAGFQFLHDIFSFFYRWEFIVLFGLSVSIFAMLMPTGPFAGSRGAAFPPRSEVLMHPSRILVWLRKRGIHYPIFLLIALSVSVMLTTNWGLIHLSEDINYDERALSDTARTLKTKLLAFSPIPEGKSRIDEFERRFYDELTFDMEIRNGWTTQMLKEFTKSVSSGKSGDDIRSMIEGFQKFYSIDETPEFTSDDDFEKSKTYATLVRIRFNNKLNRMLGDSVETALSDIRHLLSGHLTSSRDFSSLVVIPANYEIVNNSIRRIETLRKNILTFFKPDDTEAKGVMRDLASLREIRFGSMLLVFSFWVLIGLLMYLIVNVPKMLRFQAWEKSYLFFIFFMFLTIAIILPSAYGRYKFEFYIQKLTDIVFVTEGKGVDPIQKKIDELWKSGASLYILGPTKGKEVIVGAIRSEKEPSLDTPKIIVMDREILKYIIVEPARPEDIPFIIKMLRYRRVE